MYILYTYVSKKKSKRGVRRYHVMNRHKSMGVNNPKSCQTDIYALFTLVTLLMALPGIY